MSDKNATPRLVHVIVNKEIDAKIEGVKNDLGINTRSEAIRFILKKGLESLSRN